MNSTKVSTLGNKIDCEELRVVTTDDGRKFAESIGACFFETSAKKNINVTEMFHQATR